MAIAWGIKRQLMYFSIFALFIAAIIGIVIYVFYPEPSCFDTRQNQDEVGVDCGGSCAPCTNLIREPNILWTRFFNVDEDEVDVAALLENVNRFVGTSRFTYAVKLYDSENILIAIRENTTFVEPGSRFVVLETNIKVGERRPVRAVIEVRNAVWEADESEVIKIDVINTRKFLTETPTHLEVSIKNQAIRTYRDIEVQVILYNSKGDAVGVSKTFIEILNIDEQKNISFTWPSPLPDAENVEIIFRQIP
jgi:hypothetical protein